MNKRGGWGPMSERVQQAAPAPTPPPPTLKHCWVTDEHGRQPALLLQWRRTESGGFQGRVVRPVYEDGWIVVEEWLPAEVLEQA